VASSARGTTLTLNTPGAWQGAANLAFKDGAPPMRFSLKLARMPGMDLQSLSLKSGPVTLQVGQVGTSATTKYFNAKGQEQQAATGAAYTVKAERRANGDVDVHLQRGAGAALAKTMTVSWVGNTGGGRLGMIQGGAVQGVIIKD
jgi:hypothetical protein